MMANEFLHQRHADEGAKLHGIVMGAAASGTAFAFHQTADRPLTGSVVVILLAVLAWSLSFASGVINRRKLMQTLKSNLLLNEAQTNGDQIAYDIAAEYVEKHKESVTFFQEAQLWTLLAGAILYIGGHVWHLAERPEVPSVRHPAASTPIAPRGSPELDPPMLGN